jgi:acyl-CoA thioesterase
VTYEFDEATAVESTDATSWKADVAAGWDIGGVANGGFVMALMARAIGSLTGHLDPVTVTVHYTAPVRSGAVEIGGELLRRGRRLGTARGKLRQGEKVVAFALGTFGDLTMMGKGLRYEAGLPSLPPPEQCVSHREGPFGLAPPIAEKVELRIHPEHTGFATGVPHGKPEMAGWARFADGRPMDTLGMLLIADAFPPPVFNAGLPIAWVPTIELTVHVHKRPAPGWIGGSFRTDHINAGFLEEDGILWDEHGDVVALSRQIAVVPA